MTRNLNVVVRGFVLVLGLALVAAPAQADEKRELADAKAAVAYFDKYVKKAKRDENKYAGLVIELASTRHVLAAKRIAKELLKTKDEDRELICAEALLHFKDDPEGKKLAGEALLKALDRKEFGNTVKEFLVEKIGKLEYEEGVPKLNELMGKGGDPWVLLEAVRSSGRIKSWHSLPTLLELWERFPVGYSWETGEVTVDTGASGTADQEAAEAQWNAKYGSTMKSNKGKPFLLRVYIQELARAVHKITGDKSIKGPGDLRAWMEQRSAKFKEMGISIPEYKGKKRDGDGKKK